MTANTTKTMKLCFPFEKNLRERNFERHLKSTAHLKNTRQKVIYDICKQYTNQNNRQVHPQYQECNRKKTYRQIGKIHLRDINKHNNTNKHEKVSRTNNP